jgi:hypothetical protein
MAGSKAIAYHTRSRITLGADRTERQKLYSIGLNDDVFRIDTFVLEVRSRFLRASASTHHHLMKLQV